MNNSVYEKIMENLRNRVDIKLVINFTVYSSYVNKKGHVWEKIFDFF